MSQLRRQPRAMMSERRREVQVVDPQVDAVERY
jgi:hypothetical protein